MDENEEIKTSILFNNNNGEQEELKPGMNTLEWIEVDQNMKRLKISPSISDIGERFIQISVKDRSNEAITKVIPIRIRHKNTSPYIEPPPIEEWSNNSKGINNISYNEKGEVNIELAQDENVTIRIPGSIFRDRELGILPEEKLDINAKGQSELIFDQENLTLYGSTHEKGLDAENGIEEWTTVLEAKDYKNLNASLTINFIVKRIIEEPTIHIKEDNEISVEENENVKLNNIFDIRKKNDEHGKTCVQVRFKEGGEGLALKTDNGLIDLKQVETGLWEIKTDRRNADKITEDVFVEQSEQLAERININTEFDVYNYIPNTSIRSNEVRVAVTRVLSNS